MSGQLGLFTPGAEVSAAEFSPCRRYRYTLWRRWDAGKPYCQFVGLNPSTADETHDDPTVRRCIDFAKRWGYGALCMTNLFAFRATDPEVMKAAEEPVGLMNDAWLKDVAARAGVVVAAWGVHGDHLDRARRALPLLGQVRCLGLTKEGHPRHPLYVRADTELVDLRVTL
jgi:hypothetical protein